METITIDATGQNTMIVRDGRMKKSRLKWTAPGIQIFLLGPVTPQNRDALNHLAMTQVQARHIPIFSMRTIEIRRSKPPAEIASAPFLSGLWDKLNEGFDDYRHDCAMCGKPCMSVDDNGHCSSCRQVWNL